MGIDDERAQWFSIAVAAEKVHISQSTVRRYIRAGDVRLLHGRVQLGAVQDAEAAARKRKNANLAGGGARGAWLAEKVEAFFAEKGTDAGRGIVSEFVAYARA